MAKWVIWLARNASECLRVFLPSRTSRLSSRLSWGSLRISQIDKTFVIFIWVPFICVVLCFRIALRRFISRSFLMRKPLVHFELGLRCAQFTRLQLWRLDWFQLWKLDISIIFRISWLTRSTCKVVYCMFFLFLQCHRSKNLSRTPCCIHRWQ